MRIAAHGRRRAVEAGKRSSRSSTPTSISILVVSGAIDVFQVTSAGREELVVTYYRGQFTAEANMLTGRGGLARARVSKSGEALLLLASGVIAAIGGVGAMMTRRS